MSEIIWLFRAFQSACASLLLAICGATYATYVTRDLDRSEVYNALYASGMWQWHMAPFILVSVCLLLYSRHAMKKGFEAKVPSSGRIFLRIVWGLDVVVVGWLSVLTVLPF